ncbi:hypothetical protein ACP4OV_021790 [Aristida adscensionis]
MREPKSMQKGVEQSFKCAQHQKKQTVIKVLQATHPLQTPIKVSGLRACLPPITGAPHRSCGHAVSVANDLSAAQLVGCGGGNEPGACGEAKPAAKCGVGGRRGVPHLWWVVDESCGSSDERTIAPKLKSNLTKVLSKKDLCINDLISTRLNFILYLVPKLLEDGHKILMFSQSPSMLKIVESVLASTVGKEKIIRMDGTTSGDERKELIQGFQGNEMTSSSNLESSGPEIFLMSTRVGGMGITLTGASRVIILDPSENPSDDNQAVDRAYRLGQNKDVVVYRLIMCGTIEEHTYRQQILKVETSFAVLGEEQCMREITKQEGEVLIMPSEGFHVSRTWRQLRAMYGDTFDRSLSSDLQLIRNHESVFDVSDHGILYSLEEDLAPAEESEDANPNVMGAARLEKEKIDKEAVVVEEPVKVMIKVPRHVVTDGGSAVRTLRIRSGAALQILSSENLEFEDVVLYGHAGEG